MERLRRAAVGLVILSMAACSGEGHEIYLEAGCAECHGDDLRGTPAGGPSLKGVGKNWTEEALHAYFRDPDSVANSDPRLGELRDLYGEGMPPLKLADPIARETLVRYVLR